MYEQDKIEKVAKEFGEIIVTKKIKEKITYCGLMDCLKREKIEKEEIDPLELQKEILKARKRYLKASMKWDALIEELEGIK